MVMEREVVIVTGRKIGDGVLRANGGLKWFLCTLSWTPELMQVSSILFYV